MNVVNSVLGTGIWREVRIVVIVFTASALVRLLPLPRQDRDRPRHMRRRVLGVVTAGIGAVLLASCALDIAGRAAAPRSTRDALTVVDGSTVATSLRPGVGVFVAGATVSYRPVDAWARLTGAPPGLVTYYSGWGDPFQAHFARWAHKRGAVPFVQMEPTGVGVASIALGASDTYLRAFARAVRAYRWPVAVSFGPEANGPFYSWGCRHTPAGTYVAAWRHIHQVMASAGARNIIWTWDVNRIYHATCPLAARWPGRRYVDWIGVDGYWRGHGDSFGDALAPTIRAARQLAGLPVLIGETGAPDVRAASGWVRSVFHGVEHTAGVVGLVWFNYGDRLGNYRLQDDRPALAVFRAEARSYRLLPERGLS